MGGRLDGAPRSISLVLMHSILYDHRSSKPSLTRRCKTHHVIAKKFVPSLQLRMLGAFCRRASERDWLSGNDPMTHLVAVSMQRLPAKREHFECVARDSCPFKAADLLMVY